MASPENLADSSTERNASSGGIIIKIELGMAISQFTTRYMQYEACLAEGKKDLTVAINNF